jgi:predicted transcriptional regulator
MKYTSTIKWRRNLMAERRTRLEIYFDVLIAIRKGHHGADQIVHEANITPRNLDAILESLTSLDFIEGVKTLDLKGGEMSVHYSFTAKGESLMRYLVYHGEILDGRELREFYL